MAVTTKRSEALSKQRIVEAAIEILDAEGEGALTFRALASRLATGSGAIYWHVANKNDLLVAATDEVFSRAFTDVVDADPREAIRTIALGIFDAIDEHPWAGAHLHVEPWTSLGEIFEAVGGQIRKLGVPKRDRFNTASALVDYILGVAAQNAANARSTPGAERSTFLAAVADQWTRHDATTHPFVHEVAGQLRDHDDREQFLAGVNLFLAGIANAR